MKAGEATADPPERPKPLTLEQAIESGDYAEILRAQRRQITAALPNEKGPALAALHRQLSILSKEIAALEAEAKQEADEDAEVADEPFDAEAF
ncbi:MAG: hypothetical protein HOU01_10335 [Streptomycetaceae bacterium]|nr:hypothetical protein [Streptomycetaceae bacterium]